MSNRLKMFQVNMMQLFLERGWSYRRIAREPGIHPETVGRYARQCAGSNSNPAISTTSFPRRPRFLTQGLRRSVPPQYLGHEVWARRDSHVVRFFDKNFHQIAMHAKVGSERFSTYRHHLATAKISGVEKGAAWLLKKAAMVRGLRTLVTGAWSPPWRPGHTHTPGLALPGELTPERRARARLQGRSQPRVFQEHPDQRRRSQQ